MGIVPHFIKSFDNAPFVNLIFDNSPPNKIHCVYHCFGIYNTNFDPRIKLINN